MRNDIRNLIKPTEPAATIGEAALRGSRARPMRRIDVYDTAGRLHGLIALGPLVYGIIQTQLGNPIKPWFWIMVAATVGFALLVRRPPVLRMSVNGISFPETKSQIYPWDQMCEAHARADSLDILMSSGERITISFRKMRQTDRDRIKRTIKAQFQLMAERASELEAQPMSQAA